MMAAILLTAALTACNKESLPTNPYVAPPAPTAVPAIFGAVIDSEWYCIAGATIEILDGPAQGRRVQQSTEACRRFGLGNLYAFIFLELEPGTTVTLRASMAGYESRTFTTKVGQCCFGSEPVIITLTPVSEVQGRHSL